MSTVSSVHHPKCPPPQVSTAPSVHRPNCPPYQVFTIPNVHPAKCPLCRLYDWQPMDCVIPHRLGDISVRPGDKTVASQLYNCSVCRVSEQEYDFWQWVSRNMIPGSEWEGILILALSEQESYSWHWASRNMIPDNEWAGIWFLAGLRELAGSGGLESLTFSSATAIRDTLGSSDCQGWWPERTDTLGDLYCPTGV